MNNEPVAWWAKNRNTGIGYVQISKPTRMDKVANEYLPLYTHPAKEYKPNQTLECSFDLAGFKPPAKTLTDEEIEEVFRTVEQDFALTESKKSDGGWRNFPVELGRAILRKAQEK